MKRFFLSISLICLTFLSFAQEANLPELSEDESRMIAESPEFRQFISCQQRFINIITGALSQGIPLSSIRNAVKNDLATGGNENFCSLVFTEPDNGKTFLKEAATAKSALAEKFNINEKFGSACMGCQKSLDVQADFFLNLFENFDPVRPPMTGVESTDDVQGGYVCGSLSKRVSLILCSASCAIRVSWLGALLCGWECWCTYCSANSELANRICF